MDKKILFIALGSKEWIGGLYYVKNIIYSLVQNEYKNIYILTTDEYKSVFEQYEQYGVRIIIYKDKGLLSKANKFLKKISLKLFRKSLDLQIIYNVYKNKISFIFPVTGKEILGMMNRSIFWIPDFQYKYLPHLFTKEEIDKRNKIINYIAERHKYLILSSEDAYNQYKEIYPSFTQNVFVIPFVSNIEDEIKALSEERINEILNKYKCNFDYIFCANQFWKHKNHITLFKAVDIIVNKYNKKDFKLICTGNTNDYRNKDYFNELTEYIKEKSLNNNIIILGFISREEQIALMIKSKICIQPSFFEGWGTSVEDAKAVGKKIILSNIDVHYEQASSESIIFKKDDSNDLANKIIDNYSLSSKYDLSLKNAKLKAKEYGAKMIKIISKNY